MITYAQALILGFLQGISELFPVSSLGHSVILPTIFGWNIDQSAPFFLNFLVALHLATAAVLVGFFWRDWVNIVKGLYRSLRDRQIAQDDVPAKLGWLLVVGTIPAGILGLLFEKTFRHFFASPLLAAGFLFLNGILLYIAELLRHRAIKAAESSDKNITKLSWAQSFGIGAAQAIALIPGFSRSGASMAGGLLMGLNHEDAVRFSFLLATPIIAAAALLKIPELVKDHTILGPALVGAIAAAAAAYFSVKFLVRFFQTNTLRPFALYCLIAGFTSFLIIWAK